MVRYDVKVPMRDGVRLSADVYLPAGEGAHPLVLHRTPYNNNEPFIAREAEFYTEQGYAYVAQDCRGKFDSEGEWFPYRHETADGDDTLTWCAEQPWANGRVGMTGGSYCGTVQWYAASAGNPRLKCIVPMVAFSDLFFDHGLRREGAFQPFFLLWCASMAGRTTFSLDPARESAALSHVPLVAMDEFLGFDLPYWKEFVRHETYDDFWRALSLRERYGKIDVPSLNVAGWHSPWELAGTLRNFAAMSELARSSGQRGRHKLIVGAWSHAVNLSQRVGEYDFGEQARIDLQQIELRWFDRWLKGEENGIEDEPNVRIFVMGEDVWRDEEAWPLERARATPFFLHSGGRANSLHGDGFLSLDPAAAEEPADNFCYDPQRPVPAVVEAGKEDDLYLDRRPIERRDDVLVYTTEELAEDLELTGPVAVRLFAATSAPDTDFVATLIDVHPDGLAKPLTFGVARGRYREGFEAPTLLESGRVYEWSIDLWATSHLFRRGHRLRLDVSSSFFPFFGRNHNTGNPTADDTEFQLADQIVHHSAHWPSQVIVPVVPREGQQSP